MNRPGILSAMALGAVLVGAASGAEQRESMRMRSLEPAKAAYETILASEPKQEEPREPVDSNSEIVAMPKFTVRESYANRALAEDIQKRERELKLEEFDWVRGGLVHRSVGRKVTVDTGVWAPGKIMEFVRIRW